MPTFFSAALLSGAFFLSGFVQTLTLVLLMLLAPLFDKKWRLVYDFNRSTLVVYALFLLLCALVVSVYSVDRETIINQLMFVAIPEEVFFRSYLMRVWGMNVKANLLSSILFALLHAITRGWVIGIAVFIPSLLFGAIYKKYNDVLIVVFVHFLSNMFFLLVLAEWWNGSVWS